MRNQYGGECYRCGLWVEEGEGHFERFRSVWHVQHANCAIDNRGIPDPERAADTLAMMKRRAKGTGRRAQRARRYLLDLEADNEQ